MPFNTTWDPIHKKSMIGEWYEPVRKDWKLARFDFSIDIRTFAFNYRTGTWSRVYKWIEDMDVGGISGPDHMFDGGGFTITFQTEIITTVGGEEETTTIDPLISTTANATFSGLNGNDTAGNETEVDTGTDTVEDETITQI
eukprot:UN31109